MSPNSQVFSFIILLLGAASCLAAEYRLKDAKNNTCIILKAELQFSFPYKANNANAMANWTVNEAASIKGSCSSNASELLLSFTKPQAQLQLNFVNSNGRVSLANVQLTVVVVNGSVFVNATEKGNKTQSVLPKLQLSSDSEYYQCSETLLSLTAGASVTASSLQLQAFGIQNDSLSADSSTCAADQSTTEAPTTSSDTTEAPTTSANTTIAPTTEMPTPEPTPPLLNFSVRSKSGVECLSVQMRANFLISYRSKDNNKTKTKDVVLPTSTSAGGKCGNSTQTLQLSFYSGWKADMQFDGSSGSEYRLSRVSITYKLNSMLFPDAADAGKSFTSTSNDTFFKVAANGYYSCNSKLSYKLDSRVTVETSDLQAQAFRSNGTERFTGTRVQCEADLPHDNIVPIVVGSALAALVLVVLVAYIIGRRRSAGSGYQSV